MPESTVKIMKFNEAYDIVLGLVPEDVYVSLTHTKCRFISGVQVNRNIYTETIGHTEANTWEEAIHMMKKKLFPQPAVDDDSI